MAPARAARARSRDVGQSGSLKRERLGFSFAWGLVQVLIFALIFYAADARQHGAACGRAARSPHGWPSPIRLAGLAVLRRWPRRRGGTTRSPVPRP
jgi:hypothetical protein